MEMQGRLSLALAAVGLAVCASAVADGPPTITSGPPDGTVTRATSAKFAFTYADPAPQQRFECQVDQQPWARCLRDAMPEGEHVAEHLADGRHQFRVRRAGGLANGDPLMDGQPSPARWWVVDTTGPETKIVTWPRGRLRAGRAASFAFRASEASVSFACSFDGAPFAGCTSPVTVRRVRPGAHRFAVTAIDAVGNPDLTPDSRVVRVSR
jgi:hypothetical protein